MGKPYPLEPLRRVRTERVEDEKRKLAQAIRTVDASQDALATTERTKVAFEHACAQIDRGERERLELGRVRAVDLARVAAWHVGTQIERCEHAHRIEAAESALASAERQAQGERQRLARAQADGEVVERDRSMWEARQRSAKLAAEEEEAADMHRARMHDESDL